MSSTRSPYLRFGLIFAAVAFILDQITKWVVTVPLSLEQWLICVAMSSSVLWFGEIRKWALRWWRG